MEYTLSTFTAHSGFTSAKVTSDNGDVRHVHSLVKPEAESRFYDDLTLWGDTLVFLGTGIGYHVKDKITQLCDDTRSIIAVEYYDTLLDHFVMQFPVKLQQQIIRLSGKTIDQMQPHLEELIQTNGNTKIQIVTHPASFSLHQDFYRGILDRIMPGKSSNQYASSPAHNFSTTVCVMKGGHFLEQELHYAFKQCGIDRVHSIDYSEEELRNSYESRLQHLLQELKPDFLLSVNMKGIDSNGALQEYTRQLGIPLVVWFVDDPHPILIPHGTHIRNHMIACCWEKEYMSYLNTCGFSSVHYLPLAADIRRYTPHIEAAPHIQIAFVGSAIYGDYLCKIRNNFNWNEDLETLVNECARLLRTDNTIGVYDALKKGIRSSGKKPPFNDKKNITWLCAYILHYASMLRRKQYVETLMQRDIEVFGDPEQWQALVGTSLITHPSVDYYSQLDTVYQSAKINLNITNYQMKSGCNQRVFDAPLCGGFLISDAQEDLFALFDTPQQSIVTYDNPEELCEKTDWYLSHDEERKKIVARAQSHIRANHCYEHRARDIISML